MGVVWGFWQKTSHRIFKTDEMLAEAADIPIHTTPITPSNPQPTLLIDFGHF